MKSLMKQNKLNRHAIALTVTAVVLSLSACAVGPDYARPNLSLPDTYGVAEQGVTSDPNIADTNPTSQSVPDNWWTLYQDVMLNSLIDTAQVHNQDVAQAVARIEEADAALREVGAAFLPQIDLGASGNRSRISTVSNTPVLAGSSPVRNTFQLGLSTTFELDFWGKIRRTQEDYRARALGTRYARDVTLLTLSGLVAQSYFNVRSLDSQLQISQQSLTVRDESLQLAQTRSRAGLASDLDLRQAESARADTAATIKDLQRQRQLAEHQLALLTGQPGLRVAPLHVADLPVPPIVPTGLPSALISQRPDVAQAEQALASANAQIGVSKAAQLPTFSLTGNYGGQSRDLSDLLTAPGRIWSFGLGATLPILDAGRYSARTQQAEARQKQALVAYQKSLESAFKEVADALSNRNQYQLADTDLQLRTTSAKEVLRLAQLRYKAGYSAYLEVLDAQRTANDAELALVRNRTATLQSSVDLMRALGGGWQQASSQH